jgi:hypothetical protein
MRRTVGVKSGSGLDNIEDAQNGPFQALPERSCKERAMGKGDSFQDLSERSERGYHNKRVARSARGEAVFVRYS